MHILLTGATGLLGQGVAAACLEDSRVRQLTVLTRRPSGLTGDRVNEHVLADFARAADLHDAMKGIDACFYCAGAPPLGTTETEYRRVTLQLTLAVARAYADANPQGRLLYVSGARSDPRSRLMPLRVKGETERALQQLPIITVMLRPGGILPADDTRSPHRLLRMLHGMMRPVQGAVLNAAPALATTNAAIGRAMLTLARMPAPPRVVECGDINRLAAAGKQGGAP